MKVKSIIGLIITLAIIAGLVFTAVCGFTITMPISGNQYYFTSVMDPDTGIKRGLDLVGGSIVSLDASIDNPSDSDMEAVVEVMRRRLDNEGYYDAIVERQGNKTVRISIPNISDPEEAVQLLKATAKLTFVDAAGNEIMQGSEDVKNATYVYGPVTENGPAIHHVQLELTSSGQQKFATATAAAAAKTDGSNYISIKLDDTVISSPRVSEAINSTTCVITGDFTEDSAKALAGQIQSGQLPFSLVESELRSVGPTLGDKALETSLLAAAIGIAIVILFMIFFYRAPGVMAGIALIGYIALVALVVAGYFLPSGMKPTLTLPGIAGIILSIGMAVDANVIIFERIKEELRAGKTAKAAVQAGFNRALSAIIDGNITTIIAAIVLGYFGTGTIKGFAVTLAIGVIISMITAIFVTRLLLNIMLNLGVTNPALFGVSKEKEVVNND
ncbi:MAG: protein translocase subunit SecD [Clostridia bacterium]|nr:protein translocase subunit SecD [Clostridia bacterium]